MRLRLPEQQFDAVSCQLSSAGGPQHEKAKPLQNANLVVLVAGMFFDQHVFEQVRSHLQAKALGPPTPFAGPEPSPPSLNLWLLVVRCWFLNVLVLYAPMTK